VQNTISICHKTLLVTPRRKLFNHDYDCCFNVVSHVLICLKATLHQGETYVITIMIEYCTNGKLPNHCYDCWFKCWWI